MFEIKYIEDEPALSKVLHLCYSVLGESTAQNELYCYDAWKKRMGEFSRLLVYAQENERVISLVISGTLRWARPTSQSAFMKNAATKKSWKYTDRKSIKKCCK